MALVGGGAATRGLRSFTGGLQSSARTPACFTGRTIRIADRCRSLRGLALNQRRALMTSVLRSNRRQAVLCQGVAVVGHSLGIHGLWVWFRRQIPWRVFDEKGDAERWLGEHLAFPSRGQNTSDTVRWVVHTEASPAAASTGALADRIRGLGMHPIVEVERFAGETSYAVRLGPYTCWDEAAQTRFRLAQVGIETLVVGDGAVDDQATSPVAERSQNTS